MDPLTHGLAGALLSGCAAPRPCIRPAAVVGAMAALVPDLDVLVRSADDPLLTLEVHRGASHSVVLVPVIALAVTLVLWPLLRRLMDVKDVGRSALLGAATAGPLDACTSFGTTLLWPFSDARYAAAIVSVVDPVLTLTLLAMLLGLLLRQVRSWALWGLCLGVVYLGLGSVQRERATFVAHVLASDRGHEMERLEVKPTLGNALVWRTVYAAQGHFHVDALRLGLLGTVEIFPGGTVARLEPEAVPLTPGSVQHRDVGRFSRLADGYTAFHPSYPFVIGDIRYAMMPQSVMPLWGIRIDPSREHSHVEFVTFREVSEEMLSRFLAMVLGAGTPTPSTGTHERPRPLAP